MSEIKLLQCPFCGGKMEIVDVSESCLYAGRYIFSCENSCIKSHSFMTEQEAVRACNTRKPMERIVEQLLDLLLCNGCSGYTNCFELNKRSECNSYKAIEKIVKAGGVE